MSGTYIAVQYDDATKDVIMEWCKENKIPNPVERDTIHTTIVYSRTTIGECVADLLLENKYAFPIGFDVFTMEQGDKISNCLVLILSSTYLNDRHAELIECGATHDFPEYNPHITLSYNIGDLDISKLPAMRFVPFIITREYKEDLIS